MCSPVQAFICMKEMATVNIEEYLQTNCTCPHTCHDHKYDYTISMASFASKYLDNLMESDAINGINVTSTQFYRDNYVDLNIFYKDLVVFRTTEQKAYEPLTLAADLGGALGLILGSTVMTFAEIIDFTFYWIKDRLVSK